MTNTQDPIRDYESVFICPVDMNETAMETLLSKFQKSITDAAGKLGLVEKWGRRKLSYPIRHQKEGFYLYWTFGAPAKAVKTLNDLYQVSDGVLRHIIVRLEKPPVPKAAPVPQAAAAAPVESAPSI